MTPGQFALLALIAWLPGAVLFRVPVLHRERRAVLPAEERLFWQCLLSIVLALSTVLALAALGRYRFEYLLASQFAIAAVPLLVWRRSLSLAGMAPRPGTGALMAVLLVALCAWRFSSPAEYIIGGKDPGAYVNEGVQIAQRGTLVIRDPVVSAVPPVFRDLFFPAHGSTDYYGLRFMAFFIHDPAEGTVVGQFPHLFPAALAVGYGIDGLSGVRRTTPFLATMGVLAVFLAGAALFGRAAGFAAAILLALNVVQLWFARYPNTEVMMQMMLFAAVLSSLRWHSMDDPFFAALTGLILGLTPFLRVDAVLAIGAAVVAVVVALLAGQRFGWKLFTCTLLVPLAMAAVYLTGPMRAYVAFPVAFVRLLPLWQHIALGGAAVIAALVLVAAIRNARVRNVVHAWLPSAVALVVTVAAVYALVLRQPGGRLAAPDAYALRTFANFYVTVPAVIAAVLGFALYARSAFWRSPVFFLITASFGLFFFYKLRIVPEHFWAARRFVPVLLPATLLLAAAAAAGGHRAGAWPVRILRGTIGIVFLSLLGAHYWRVSTPVAAHVEYAGVIPKIEQLAAQIRDDDLVIVEARDAGGDNHVVALPLAYIYARNVLVLDSARPDPGAFSDFSAWARNRYDRVLFLGGAGTDLSANRDAARRIWQERFSVPEYESTLNAYPRSAQQRKFEWALYELQERGARPEGTYELDVGEDDDLSLLRFGGKEVADGRTFRWTAARSVVALGSLPIAGREITLTMSDGGRPDAAPPAHVEVWVNDRHVTTFEVDGGFRDYSVRVPSDLGANGAHSELRLHSVLWNPQQVLGLPDGRNLGVMVDRLTIR